MNKRLPRSSLAPVGRVLAFWLGLCALSNNTQCIGMDVLNRVRIAQEGFLANYNSFTSYYCKQQIRAGTTSDAEKALQMGPDQGVVVATASIAIDRRAVCYQRESNERLKVDPATGMGSMLLTPQSLLADRDFYMIGSRLLNGVSVSSESQSPDPSRWKLGLDMTTWNNTGVLSAGDSGMFGKFISGYLVPKGHLVIQENVERHGVKTLQVDARAQGQTTTFFIDENRGFIPIEMRLSIDSRPFVSAFVTEIRECSEGRWFPTRCVAIWAANAEGIHTVREVLVKELEADTPPEESMFAIELPAGTLVNDPDRSGSQYRLNDPTTVTLASLELLHRGTTLGGLPVKTSATKSPWSGWRGWVLGINVLLVAALLLVYFVLTRGRRVEKGR